MNKLKNSRKVTRTMVILLLILLGSLSQLAFHVPSVSAYDHIEIHPYMTEESAKVLPLDSAMYEEIALYLDQIKHGARDEDETDHAYSEDTHNYIGIRAIPHYWDADGGPDDPVKGIGTVLYTPEEFPNAFQKAWELFEMALTQYFLGNLEVAYEYLGHVAHLIQDQSVPAHVHEDFHVSYADINLPGGDDSFEHWIHEGGEGDENQPIPIPYLRFDAGSALATGGLVPLPDDLDQIAYNHGWGYDRRKGALYYLMYTTNQRADYFASDDCDGDTDDPEGWMDYSGWPSSPRTTDDIQNNDHGFFGDTLDDDDNNRDGDLGRIASKTYVYAIRAVATLYKVFYEITHDPVASIENIIAVDENGDGAADFQWVRLNITYNVGADEYFSDLRIRFANEEDLNQPYGWKSYVPSKPGGCIVPWVLSEGDGPKTVHMLVYNVFGSATEVTATIELDEIGVPQLFHYEFNATGAAYASAQVDFYITGIWAGNVEFYFDAYVDDGHGAHLSGTVQKPGSNLYYDCVKGQLLDLTQLYEEDVELRSILGPGWVVPAQPFDWSHIHTVSDLLPGEEVRLCTHAYDHNILDDDDLETVWTPILPIPNEEGTHVLADEVWYEHDENGEVNPYYTIVVTVIATVSWEDWSGHEVPPEPFNPTFVRYGAGEDEIYTSQLLADADRQNWCNVHTTQWQVTIDNPAVRYRMDGPTLYAWTWHMRPDMVVAGLSPVHLLITDPLGRRVGTLRYPTGEAYWDPWLGMYVMIYETETYNEVPGASVVQVPTISGDQITLIVFDQRELGDYQIQASPILGADLMDTYSIGVSWQYWHWIPIQIQSAFLIEDVQVAEIPTEPYVIQSTAPPDVPFTLTVNLPPRADPNGPYRATEGTTINFDASGSTDPDGDSLTYRWDFEDDGTWDTDWSSSPTASHTWNNDWTGTARVEVSDGALTDTSTATVTVSNVAPTVNAGPDQLAAVDEEVHFSGSLTDPGVLDTHTIEWDFGDGTTVTSTLTPTHVYSEARKYTVTLTVTDDDGGIGRDTLTVNTGVEVLINPLSAYVLPGESATYNVLIHHLGNTQDVYNLALYGLDAAWYTLSTTSITLDPDQTKTITLTVSPPFTATTKTYGFTVMATSQTDPTIVAIADADVVVGEHLYIALTMIDNLREYVTALYENGEIDDYKFGCIMRALNLTLSDIMNARGYLDTVRHGFDDKEEGLSALLRAVKRLENLVSEIQDWVKWGLMPSDLANEIIQQLESINVAMAKKPWCEAEAEKLLAVAAIEDAEARGGYLPWLWNKISYIEQDLARADYWLAEGELSRAIYYFRKAFSLSQSTTAEAWHWSWDISLEDWIDQLEESL